MREASKDQSDLKRRVSIPGIPPVTYADSEEDPRLEEAKFGVSLLDMIFSDTGLRTSLMSSPESISSVIHSLYPFIRIIENCLSDEDGYLVSELQIPHQLLLATLDLYYRLMLHVGALAEEKVTTPFSFLIFIGLLLSGAFGLGDG